MLSRIPTEAISISFLEAGQHHSFADGYIHCKTAPMTIVAQPLSGRYEVLSGGRRVVAGLGEAFLARDGQPLEIAHHAAKRGELMSAHWIHARFLVFTTIDFVSLLSLPPKVSPTNGIQFGKIISELLQLQAPSPAASLASMVRQSELGCRALRLLCEISVLSDSGEAFLHHAGRLAPVLTYIRENLAAELSIDELADVAKFSRSRFHSYFRAHMQISPMDYVKRVRISEAKQLLMTTAEPVYSIAESTGFANPYHFSREFKSNSGLSPIQFRKQNGGLQV